MIDEPIEVGGDFTPVRLSFGGELYFVCIGEAGPGVVSVKLNDQSCGLTDGKWASPPMPYSPGWPVQVVLTDDQGRSKELRAHLPAPNALGPIMASDDWVGYAPAHLDPDRTP